MSASKRTRAPFVAVSNPCFALAVIPAPNLRYRSRNIAPSSPRSFPPPAQTMHRNLSPRRCSVLSPWYHDAPPAGQCVRRPVTSSCAGPSVSNRSMIRASAVVVAHARAPLFFSDQPARRDGRWAGDSAGVVGVPKDTTPLRSPLRTSCGGALQRGTSATFPDYVVVWRTFLRTLTSAAALADVLRTFCGRSQQRLPRQAEPDLFPLLSLVNLFCANALSQSVLDGAFFEAFCLERRNDSCPRLRPAAA